MTDNRTSRSFADEAVIGVLFLFDKPFFSVRWLTTSYTSDPAKNDRVDIKKPACSA